MNKVRALYELMKPNRPLEVINWRAIESNLVVSLPSDFKEFWTLFPSGSIGFSGLDDSLFVLHSPYSSDRDNGFPSCVWTMSENYRKLRDEFPDFMRHRMWPESEGLIGFAHDSNGVDYYLHSVTWHVHADGDGVDENYGVCFSEFLWRLAHNEILVAPAFQGEPGSTELTIWTEY